MSAVSFLTNKNLCAALFFTLVNFTWIQVVDAATSREQVIAAGAVPTEAAKTAILTRLRELYGAERIVDQISVGGVASSPDWSSDVVKTLSSDLKSVSKGQMIINATTISLKGEVPSEALRQKIANDISPSTTYVVKNELRVPRSEQNVLDKTLANRIVEFATASATLTPAGEEILKEMAQAMKQIGNTKVEVIGHTDGKGNREMNLALSKARADTVKSFLITKGIDANNIEASGMGPDKPIASNSTSDGRARNRRIEFRVVSTQTR